MEREDNSMPQRPESRQECGDANTMLQKRERSSCEMWQKLVQIRSSVPSVRPSPAFVNWSVATLGRITARRFARKTGSCIAGS
ncbi:hypothetical protein EH31_04040 [Erythrobacter longus]|uniref:Uncharacterized protein n=1 Tax=Erythrobacter longus TaxID=1044 RepID=A0A074MJ12_ERYLO|nr:hypothetical protein EH31_04040 [Erythrobacter longus]